MGVHSTYTEEIAENILDHISSTSDGLKVACEKYGIHRSTFHRWLNERSDLCDKYARAKELQAELLADEIIEIADDSSHDEEITENGVRMNSEYVQRSKLRIDARKWKASKLNPQKYGDRVFNETTIVEQPLFGADNE